MYKRNKKKQKKKIQFIQLYYLKCCSFAVYAYATFILYSFTHRLTLVLLKRKLSLWLQRKAHSFMFLSTVIYFHSVSTMKTMEGKRRNHFYVSFVCSALFCYKIDVVNKHFELGWRMSIVLNWNSGNFLCWLHLICVLFLKLDGYDILIGFGKKNLRCWKWFQVSLRKFAYLLIYKAVRKLYILENSLILESSR